jgi:hypothetical protein
MISIRQEGHHITVLDCLTPFPCLWIVYFLDTIIIFYCVEDVAVSLTLLLFSLGNSFLCFTVAIVDLAYGLHLTFRQLFPVVAKPYQTV